MSPSADLLRVLVGVQSAVVAALFLFLLLNRVFRNFVRRRRERWAERAAEAIRRWVVGRSSADELLRVFRDAPLTSVREALEATWGDLLEEDRERLRRAVRETRWTRRVMRHADSLFWWRRMDAAQVLAFLGTQADARTLSNLLEDRHLAVRVAATFAARDVSIASLLGPLLRQAVQAEPPRRRALNDAILSFGERVVPELSSALREEAGDPNRSAVLLELAGRVAGHSRAGRLLDPILERADDPDLEVRIQAVKALASFPEARAVEALRTRLEDPAWEVRAQAAKGLGQLHAERAREDLARALSDESWWVRLRAGVALRQIGPSGTELLESVDPEADPYAHDMAVYVLRLEDEALTDYAA